MTNEAREIEVHGVRYPVHLTPYLSLAADVGGETVTAEDLEKLREKIRVLTAKKKLVHEIPVVLDLTGRYVRAILRGITPGRAYLFTIDGKKEAIEHARIVARSEWVTDEQLAVLNDAAREAQDAAKAERRLVHALIPVAHRRANLMPWYLIEQSERMQLGEAGA